MNELPLDVHLEILAYLSINERARCRLVSKPLKNSSEFSLRSITHLSVSQMCYDEHREIINDSVKTAEEEMIGSYVRDNFLSRPFVRGRTNYFWQSDEVDPSFFPFIGKFCPYLKVLRMKGMVISRENLLHISKSIQYFTCYRFVLPTNFERKDISSSFLAPLPLLKGFDEGNDWCDGRKECATNCLARRLLQLNRPIAKIYMTKVKPILRLLDRESGVRCLDIRRKKDAPSFYSVSKPLAQSIEDLTVNFVPNNEFCKFALPKLRYLKVINKFDWPPPIEFEGKMISASNLKGFSFHGNITYGSLLKLLQYFHSLEHLQEIELKATIQSNDYHPVDGEKKDIEFYFPPNLKKLTIARPSSWLRMSYGSRVKLAGCVPESLEYLKINELTIPEFNLSNHEFNLNLKLICGKITREVDSSKLIKYLSKCIKLEILELRFTFCPEVEILQSLVDMLLSLPNLDHLKLVGDYRAESLSGTIHFRHYKLPSLRRLLLTLPHHIVFYPADVFYSIHFGHEPTKSLAFENKTWGMYCQINGKSSEPLFPHKMTRLTELDFRADTLPEYLVSQSSFISQIEKLEIHSEYIEKKEPIDLKNYERLFSHLNHLKTFCFVGTLNITLFTKLCECLDSVDTLTQVNLDLDLEKKGRGTLLKFSLPRRLRVLKLRSDATFFLSNVSSDSLVSLDISDVKGVFNFPALEEFHIETRNNPPHQSLLTGLAKSPELRSLHFEFDNDTAPLASFVQSLVRTASHLNHLQSLKIVDAGESKKQRHFVNINHEDICSVKKFTWNLPMKVIFHPGKKFDSLNVEDNFLCFEHKASECEYKFEKNSCFDFQIAMTIEMDVVTQLRFHPDDYLETSPSKKKVLTPVSWLMGHLANLTQVKIVDVELSENSWLEVDFLNWLSSLTSLRELKGRLTQEQVGTFLHNLKSKGPLEINIHKSTDFGVFPSFLMNDDLHKTVNQLMKKKIISKFIHPSLCFCRNKCLIREQKKVNTIGSSDSI